MNDADPNEHPLLWGHTLPGELDPGEAVPVAAGDHVLVPRGLDPAPEQGSPAPARAFRLTLRLDADDRRSLVNGLMNLALQIDREQATTGVWGSPSDGCIYEVLHDPSMPHDVYHAALRKYLDSRRPAADPIGAQEP